jgi:CheY-like chemotaxis protein
VNAMQLCTGFMSSIMNNLLDVRKMEEKKMTLKSTPISLNELMASVHKMLEPSVRPGVVFQVECLCGDQDWVLGDSHRMQQVLTNVVTNAIKYTSTGSIKLRIRWQMNGVLRFECIDTGPGIPKNDQEKLFQRFVQRGGAPGTGLGLAISKHLVDLIGGSIRFDSDPTVSAGTTCIVILPLPPCVPPSPDITVKAEWGVIEKEVKFLIIDDIKMNRMMLKRRIKGGIAPNALITEAATGEEALEICKNKTFDVIVVDQYMEEAGGIMVGTDVVYAMRRSKIDSIIIGCSGNDIDELFADAGTDWVWKKPIPSNSEILGKLHQALRERESS